MAKWIQKAIKKPGAFTKQAKAHDMTAQEHAAHVKAHPEQYTAKTRKRAALATTLSKLAKKR